MFDKRTNKPVTSYHWTSLGCDLEGECQGQECCECQVLTSYLANCLLLTRQDGLANSSCSDGSVTGLLVPLKVDIQYYIRPLRPLYLVPQDQ